MFSKIPLLPYGRIMYFSVIPNTAYKFTGQEFDEETGLHNFRARLYDAEIGMFYAYDPAAQGFSPFGYCGNNPVIRIDRNGKLFFLPILIGAAIGGTLGALSDDLWYQGFLKGVLVGAVGGLLGQFGTPANWLLNTLEGAGQGVITGGLNNVLHHRSFFSGAGLSASIGGAFGLITSQNFKNALKGQGWQNDSEVWDNFISQNKFQYAIDYFGGNGKYLPPDEFLAGENHSAYTDAKNNIYYGDGAFNKGVDYFKAMKYHESFHEERISKGLADYRTAEVVKGKIIYPFEELAAWENSYFNQGLYPDAKINYIDKIRLYDSYGDNIYLGAYDRITGKFIAGSFEKWWYFIYKIPRRF